MDKCTSAITLTPPRERWMSTVASCESDHLDMSTIISASWPVCWGLSHVNNFILRAQGWMGWQARHAMQMGSTVQTHKTYLGNKIPMLHFRLQALLPPCPAEVEETAAGNFLESFKGASGQIRT